jgi:DNA repair protein RecO (recombination protein O)
MIHQSRAIILRTTDFQESSRIVAVYTREFGKVSLMAKGAKSAKSKYLGKLDPGMLVELVYHNKDGRSIQILSEITLLKAFSSLSYQPDRLSARLAFTDLLNRIIEEGVQQSDLFDKCEQVILWLNETPQEVISLFPYVMIRLAEWLGFGIRQDLAEATSQSTFFLDPDSGSLTSQPGHRAMQLSASMFSYIKLTIDNDRKGILDMQLSTVDLRQLVYLMDRYLSYHIDGLKPRSVDILFESFEGLQV